MTLIEGLGGAEIVSSIELASSYISGFPSGGVIERIIAVLAYPIIGGSEGSKLASAQQ